MAMPLVEKQFRKRPKTTGDQFRARAGLKGMDAGGKKKGRRCPPLRLQRTSSTFHHIIHSVCTSYAAVCTLCTSFGRREPHTVHTAAYGSHWNPALALLPVGIGASSARENQKCIRIRIRILADSRRNRPLMKLIRLCPLLIPLDAQVVFCPCTPFFGPSDGLSSFWGIEFCRYPIRAVPQGPPRIRFPGDGRR